MTDLKLSSPRKIRRQIGIIFNCVLCNSMSSDHLGSSYKLCGNCMTVYPPLWKANASVGLDQLIISPLIEIVKSYGFDDD